MAKQNSDELALAVIDDLEEDGVTIASKRSLELLLENPDNPEFPWCPNIVEPLVCLAIHLMSKHDQLV